jgi:hypothetical protein
MEIQEINRAESLSAITYSEIDQQIKTAKTYPRVLSQVLSNIDTMATYDKEVAESCFYALPRGGKTITGLSVRFAEIVASCWGNLRAGARIISNDGKLITAQGLIHDLETNVAITVEVSRKITDKYGKTFSQDMQIVTANACCSIAFRNAIYKAVPSSLFKGTVDKIKEVSIGKAIDLQTSRENAMKNFKALNVEESDVFKLLKVKKEDDIDRDKLFILKGVFNAIKDSEITIEEAFGKPSRSKKSKISDLLGDASDELATPTKEKDEKKAKSNEGQTSISLD